MILHDCIILLSIAIPAGLVSLWACLVSVTSKFRDERRLVLIFFMNGDTMVSVPTVVSGLLSMGPVFLLLNGMDSWLGEFVLRMPHSISANQLCA